MPTLQQSAVTLQDIRDAAQRIAGQVYVSPCTWSEALSQITGCNIYCKLEYMQRTGSFKERGARNALMLLDDERKRRGVIAASAGNHALALTEHARLLGIPVTVVMPTSAPLTKIVNCRQRGATVILHGSHIDEARQHAMTLVESQGLTYINGYDDPAIIAGQGTIGLEILEQVPDVDAVIVPVGGAGLIAGIALAIKSLKPQVKVYGVEPKRVASLTAALAAGRPVMADIKPTLADGLAVPKVGEHAFALARQHVDAVYTVGERAIALAVLRLIELEKSVVEGAGAAGLAACMQQLIPDIQGKNVVLPLCGGNIDTTVIGRIIERGLVVDGRLCRFDATISDRPGGLAHFTRVIADTGASVKDIAHDRAFAGEDLNTVVVHCVLETRDADHINEVRDRLEREGFEVNFRDLR